MSVKFPIRSSVLSVHRWLGLATGLLLILAGLTGSVIAFRPELDAWLNPDLLRVPSSDRNLPLTLLVEDLERSEPRVRVVSLTPPLNPHGVVIAKFTARTDPATGKPFHLGFNELYLDPSNGKILGSRDTSAFRFDRRHLIPLIYELHYTLAFPGLLGRRIMGTVAFLWMFNGCFGLYLTFPRQLRNWRRWSSAWLPKGGQGIYRRCLDVHRVTGLWLSCILLTLAVSGVSLNLSQEIFRPIVSFFGALTPLPLTVLPKVEQVNLSPKIDWDEAVQRAVGSLPADARDWRVRFIGYLPERNVYRVRLVEPGFRSKPFHIREEQRYLDANTGEIVAATGYVSGTTADRFIEWQFPLHTGQAFGVLGRCVICLTGLLIVTLAITGGVIWWQKTRVRALRTSSTSTSSSALERVRDRI